MTLADASPDQPRVLADELRRVVDRLRSMPLSRLSADGPAGSAADRAHALAQALADLAADHAGSAVRRQVPRLSDSAVGDQVAVTGQDLLDQLATDHDGPATAAAAEDALARVTALRRSL